MADDFYAQFMRGFQSGNAITQQRRQAEQDRIDQELQAEERKIRREALLQQAKTIKLQEAIQNYKLKREGVQQQVESASMQQTPQMQPPQAMEMGPEGQPGVSPEEAAMMVPVADPAAPRTAQLPGLTDPNSGEQLIPETQVPIQYGDDIAKAERMKKHQAMLDEFDKAGVLADIKARTEAKYRPEKEPAGFTLSPGQTRYEGGKAVASRPDKAPSPEKTKPPLAGELKGITEIDTGLAEAETLRGEVSKTGATGAMAQVGAALPNFVSEATGWGITAKQREGVIARVKQVIGKALEGGVLRKEDEAKYAKILPTISDPPEVAQSKIDGLIATLEERRNITMENLQDAGRDVSKLIREPKAPKADVKSLAERFRQKHGTQ